METQDELDRAIEEMRSHFLVPPGPEETFSELDALIFDLDPDYRIVGESFRYNLASVLSTVAMPFALASASVQQTHFQRIHIAERIRARCIEDADLGPGDSLEEVRGRHAYRVASHRIREFTESQEGKNLIIRDICEFLLASVGKGGLESAAQELLQQGTLLLWSAFEVLFRDTFALYLNLNPSKVEVLLRHASTRKRFEIEKFSLDTLVQHGFNLSKKIGTVLVSQTDFIDLPTVKAVYPVLFPSCGDLVKCLHERDLWLLYQRRHLFVHRRGIVDQAYVENTGEALRVGSRLTLKPDNFEVQFKLVLRTGHALISCLPR